jgi:hypothetical protein
VALEDLPHGGRRDADAEGRKLPGDAPVTPVLVLAGHAQHQVRDVPMRPRPARPTPGLLHPPAPDEVAMPAHNRARHDQTREPSPPGARDEREQGGHQRPVSPRQANPARLLPLEHCYLVAQKQDLRVLPRIRTDGEAQPRREPEDEQEHEPKTHEPRSSTGSARDHKPSSRIACDLYGRVLGTHNTSPSETATKTLPGSRISTAPN